MRMNLRMPFRLALLAAVVVVIVAVPSAQVPLASGPKRPLTHADYDAWRSIAAPTVSPDGRWLAYSFMPQDGDGDLVVRDLTTGQERREPVGALPPPPIPRPEDDTPPPPRGIRIAFTNDSRFLVASTYPAKALTEQAKKDRKKPEEMPKGGLLMMDLASGTVARAASVKNFQVPSKGGSWVAYLKEARPEEKELDAQKAGSAQAEAPTGRAASRGADKKEYGSDLVVRDLSAPDGAARGFSNVIEYAFARDGATLVYAVSSKNEAENGVFAVRPAAASEPLPLLQGKGKYAKLAFDRAQTQLAFVSSRDDAESRTPVFRVYRWDRAALTATEVVSSATPGFPPDLVVSDKGPVGFSRDGARIYVPVARPPAQIDEEAEPGNDDKVLADLWHWKDDYVQPMQRIRANQERNRTFRGVYHLDDQRYVQLADPTLATVSLSDDGLRAIGFDDRPYRRMVDYDGTYTDVYLVDARTGSRTAVATKLSGGSFGRGSGVQWSPDGRFAAFFKDKHWHVIDASTGTTRNLTEALSVSFVDEEDDTPDPPTSYGSAGWTKDGLSFLAYDRYDIWQLFADGQPAKNVTNGEGRVSRTEFRLQSIEPPADDDEERGIDPAKPLYLRGESEETRASGFFEDSLQGSGAPRRLLWGDRNYRYAGRARDADVLLVTASRFDEYPDLHVTDSTFRAPTRVSDGGAQLTAFSWGRAELVRFRNTDGVPLQAVLYKPADFDPTRKYPMLVYIYERLSQDLHDFVAPSPGTSINRAYYVSNGYLVLTPDIVYAEGTPGASALKSVLPAIDAVVDGGFVNEDAIGIQGHSWGGYQIAYMITQTTRFRAAEAGAPVGNMTSAYSGIRWGSGLPRQWQYEQAQSRIGRPLVDAPLTYFENSPVFFVNRVTTPLLMIHNDADDAVPWYQGIELFLALRRQNKEAYLFNYNGEFHGLRRRHNQVDFTIRMQQFFDHFLKGAPKPEWMEKGIPYLDRETEKERFKATTRIR